MLIRFLKKFVELHDRVDTLEEARVPSLTMEELHTLRASAAHYTTIGNELAAAMSLSDSDGARLSNARHLLDELKEYGLLDRDIKLTNQLAAHNAFNKTRWG